MSEKLIVHKIPVEMQKQSIEETYMLILFLELRGKYLKIRQQENWKSEDRKSVV